jgi:DNA-binding FrmR family transcriptional regulator
MDKIAKALARAKGQVAAVERMYLEQKPCFNVVQQLAAAKEALNRIGREILKAEACQLVTNQNEKRKLEKVLQRLFKS